MDGIQFKGLVEFLVETTTTADVTALRHTVAGSSAVWLRDILNIFQNLDTHQITSRPGLDVDDWRSFFRTTFYNMAFNKPRDESFVRLVVEAAMLATAAEIALAETVGSNALTLRSIQLLCAISGQMVTPTDHAAVVHRYSDPDLWETESLYTGFVKDTRNTCPEEDDGSAGQDRQHGQCEILRSQITEALVVPFDLVPQLVSWRSVCLHAGYALVPRCVHVLDATFEGTLTACCHAALKRLRSCLKVRGVPVENAVEVLRGDYTRVEEGGKSTKTSKNISQTGYMDMPRAGSLITTLEAVGHDPSGTPMLFDQLLTFRDETKTRMSYESSRTWHAAGPRGVRPSNGFGTGNSLSDGARGPADALVIRHGLRVRNHMVLSLRQEVFELLNHLENLHTDMPAYVSMLSGSDWVSELLTRLWCLVPACIAITVEDSLAYKIHACNDERVTLTMYCVATAWPLAASKAVLRAMLTCAPSLERNTNADRDVRTHLSALESTYKKWSSVEKVHQGYGCVKIATMARRRGTSVAGHACSMCPYSEMLQASPLTVMDTQGAHLLKAVMGDAEARDWIAVGSKPDLRFMNKSDYINDAAKWTCKAALATRENWQKKRTCDAKSFLENVRSEKPRGSASSHMIHGSTRRNTYISWKPADFEVYSAPVPVCT